MNFPEALQECINGKRITNKNWNGKGMYVFAMPGYPEGVPANETLSEHSGVQEGQTVVISPYLMMFNAKGEFSNWLISNMDVFSDGWETV